MTERQHRVEALRKLVADAGGAAALAKVYSGVDPSYVSQLLNGHRAFGERAARKMESQLGLPRGFLDAAPGAPMVLREPEVRHTRDELEVIALWRDLVDEQKAKVLGILRSEAEFIRRAKLELAKRNLQTFVPDAAVAKHIAPVPPQVELPITGEPAAKRPRGRPKR